MPRYRIGVDIGGTFTDFVFLDEGTGDLRIKKLHSTPGNPALAVARGLREAINDGLLPDDITFFAHGTTVATNALLERKGAKIGLLVTKGFRGIQEVQTQLRTGSVYDVVWERPESLVTQDLTGEIAGRIDGEGNEVIPLDTAAVKEAVKYLRDRRVDSIAVCYLFSFKNPAHEVVTKNIVAAELPGFPVCLSSEVLPRIREWPRMSTTLVSAYIGGVLSSYLEALENELRAMGVSTPQLFVMQSNGGLAPFTSFARPETGVYGILAGPAAAAKGAAFWAKVSGQPDLISLDIGGTSCDVAIIENGQPLEIMEGELGGFETAIPMLDISSIGAGGGSIAWVNDSGDFSVGPQSAGAEPGPVCYGKGGLQPTVTDADLSLGYLNPGYFLGGSTQLDVSRARQAIAEKVAGPLKMDLVEAANAIRRVIDIKMAEQIKVAAARRGINLIDYAILACGGAGPVHAAAIAEELNIKRIVVPPHPGAFAAMGLICTDVIHDYLRSDLMLLSELTLERIRNTFNGLEELARRDLRAEGLPEDKARRHWQMDMRYSGQGNELRIPLANVPLTANTFQPELRKAFEETHLALRGHSAPDVPVEVVSYHVRLSVAVPKYQPARHIPASLTSPEGALKGYRNACFPNGLRRQVEVFARERLKCGHSLLIPAIVEQVDSTTLIPPGWKATVDDRLNLLLERGD